MTPVSLVTRVGIRQAEISLSSLLKLFSQAYFGISLPIHDFSVALVKGVLRTETVFASAPASAGRIPPAYSSVPQFPPSFLEGRGRGRRKEKAATQLLLRGGRRREVRGKGEEGEERDHLSTSAFPPPLPPFFVSSSSSSCLVLNFQCPGKASRAKVKSAVPLLPSQTRRERRESGRSLSFVYSHGTAAKTKGLSSSQTPRRRSPD